MKKAEAEKRFRTEVFPKVKRREGPRRPQGYGSWAEFHRLEPDWDCRRVSANVIGGPDYDLRTEAWTKFLDSLYAQGLITKEQKKWAPPGCCYDRTERKNERYRAVHDTMTS